MDTAAKVPKRRSTKVRPSTRWLRPVELPVSVSFLRALIEAGLIESYSLTIPGSRRRVRFIDANSFDAWVKSGKKGF